MRTLWLLASVLSVAAAAPAAAGVFEASPEDGRIRVLVFKKGLFSGFAHDHRFEVAAWHATAQVPEADPAKASVAVVLEAGSLHDRQEGLTSSERVEVDAKAAGPDVLDAAHHPEISWRADGVALQAGAGAARLLRGTAHGQLTLRGRTRPVDLAIEARLDGDAWHVGGKGRLRQSDFGISPFSGFLGTVGVEDEIQIEIEVTLRPAPSQAVSPAPLTAAPGAPASTAGEPAPKSSP